MVEDISALGLRHAGYAIPTEFMAPLVSDAVEVVRTMMTDKNAEDRLHWSLTLISKILGRTILEGSTIVMKSTNTNQEKALKKAISVWPSGKRAMVLSNMAVGTHSISPLYWSIENGSRVVAKAIVTDLLIIRADRDNYYYGGDELYTRHPEGPWQLRVLRCDGALAHFQHTGPCCSSYRQGWRIHCFCLER
jgi:hypothetical protein